MNIWKYVVFASFLALVSCNEKGNTEGRLSTEKKKFLPPSSGTHAEMVIVCSDDLWEGTVGEFLLKVFGQEQYGLPQSEGIFSLNRVRPEGFQGLLKRAKSLVFVEIGDSAFIKTQTNVWAQPQVVTTLVAPTKKGLLVLLNKNKDALVSIYHKADLGVVRGRMKGNTYKSLPKGLRKMGIKKMYLQEGFINTLDKDDIQIFRQDTRKTTQFLVFYKRPITEESLAGTDIIAARDTIGKYYFQGQADNSYFATEKLFPPKQFTTQIDDQFAIETRGLWMAENDFMGGPFLSYSIYNDAENEILTVEGIVYGPDAKKRDIILEMEAMMTSIKFK